MQPKSKDEKIGEILLFATGIKLLPNQKFKEMINRSLGIEFYKTLFSLAP